MEIKIFGNKIEINITKKRHINSTNNKKKFFNIRYNYRMLMILVTFIIFSMLFIYKKNSNEYTLGAISKNDVIAYKTIKYKRDLLDAELKEKIIKNTEPEYNYRKDIQEAQVAKFKAILSKIRELDLKNEDEIYKFIGEEKLKISVADIISIGINEGSKYDLYLIDVLEQIYNEGIVKKSDLNKILSKDQIVLDNFEKNLIKNFIVPNLILNEDKTEAKINENIDTLKNNTITIHKGDIIVKKGEKINTHAYEQLKELGLTNRYEKTVKSIFLTIFTIAISFYIFLGGKKFLEKGVNSKGFYPTYISYVAINIGYFLLIANRELFLFLIPVSTIAIISSILTMDKNFSIVVSTLTNLLLAPNLEWFVVMQIISIIAIVNNEKITNRMELIKNGFKIGAIQGFFVLIYTVIYSYDLRTVTIMLTFSLISGFLTGMICLGIIPYFENTFKILTDIKLLEVGDYSSPLLKRLLLEAPGTFYHSIMVGSLAEQAAEAIGANPILARVGAYYHDIGKLKRPVYFVENQGGLGNLHDELKPSLSAVILTSHPKDGYILAKQHGVPEEVLNIIQEHHGTTMAQFFYYKAVEVGENINESDFRYTGPKPSSKESAIVMLADTVEAAIRASKDKSKEGIESSIRYLIKFKIDDNQLNNCDITLSDIEKIIQAFLKVLKAAYHERIQYPKIGRK